MLPWALSLVCIACSTTGMGARSPESRSPSPSSTAIADCFGGDSPFRGLPVRDAQHSAVGISDLGLLASRPVPGYLVKQSSDILKLPRIRTSPGGSAAVVPDFGILGFEARQGSTVIQAIDSSPVGLMAREFLWSMLFR